MSRARRLRILHVSDLHIRDSDGEKEAWRRRRVLGQAWEDNLDAIRAAGSIDLLCFTGDLAFSGSAGEYAALTAFVDSMLVRLDISRERVFVVAGNHDVDRSLAVDAWETVRPQLGPANAHELSLWMAGGKPPRGLETAAREAILSRQAAYRAWIEAGLRRPQLLASGSAGHHPALGYCVELRIDGCPPVQVIGLDSAWLAGDDNDSRKLWLTDDQVMLNATLGGRPLDGFRIALVHHPLGELADGEHCRRLLAEHVDLLLHGHLHEAESSVWITPEQRLVQFAAGCLYEHDRYANACQLIEVELDEDGRPAAWEMLAEIEGAQGEIDRATEKLSSAADEVLRTSPWGKETDAWAVLARISMRLAALKRAKGDAQGSSSELRRTVELWHRAIAVDNEQAYHLALAQALGVAGRLAEATDEIGALVDADPRNVEALCLQAELTLAAGRRNEAERAVHRCLDGALDPRHLFRAHLVSAILATHNETNLHKACASAVAAAKKMNGRVSASFAALMQGMQATDLPETRHVIELLERIEKSRNLPAVAAALNAYADSFHRISAR